jgi:hypothetical protein
MAIEIILIDLKGPLHLGHVNADSAVHGVNAALYASSGTHRHHGGVMLINNI